MAKLKPGTVAPWDLYAAAALDPGRGGEPASAAELAAKLADAMLAERARREEGYQAPAPPPALPAEPPPAQGFVGEPGTEIEPGTETG